MNREESANVEVEAFDDVIAWQEAEAGRPNFCSSGRRSLVVSADVAVGSRRQIARSPPPV